MNSRTAASYEGYKKALALIAEGKTMQQACVEAKIGTNTYYKFEKQSKKETRVIKKKKSSPVFVDLKREPVTLVNEMVPTPTVAIIVCQPNQITQVLQNLRS